MSQQATKKRRRSAKQPTLRQFVEGGLDQSTLAGLDFHELVHQVFWWIRETFLLVRGDSERQGELIPTLRLLSIAMVVLRKAIHQKFSTWPPSSGIAFATWVTGSALRLIENLGNDLNEVCFDKCPAIWKPGVSEPIYGKIVNGILVYDHIDWDAKVTEKLLFTWRKQALTKIAELLPSAEEFPTFQLRRELGMVEVAFVDELRRWRSSPDADSGSAAEGATLPPLSNKAAVAWEILLKLPPHRCLTGPQLLDAMAERGAGSDQSTLTRWIIPKLKARGVEKQPRIGYFIPTNKRPAT